MRKSLAVFGAAILLIFGALGVNAAETAQSDMAMATNPVEQFTGKIWLETGQKEKEAYLFGIDTAITVEYFVNEKLASAAAKKGKKPVYTLSPFEKGWMQAFSGTTRADLVRQIDAWYNEHPSETDKPVMDVIWYNIIAPRLAK